MRKFILKETGEEVNYGDILIKQKDVDVPFGKATLKHEVIITGDVVPTLVEEGILVQKDEKIPQAISFYLSRIADRHDVTFEQVWRSYSTLLLVNPASALFIVLKEIATYIDEFHNEPIEDSPEIWAYSTLCNDIVKLDKNGIVSYANFSAFRSKEEAYNAYEVVRPILLEMTKHEQHQ